MPPKQKKGYLTYMLPAEAEKVGREAKRLGISRSDHMRRIVMGYPQPGNDQVVRDLLKITADQERLGELIELAINKGIDLEGLAGEIAQTQTLLQSKIKDLTDVNDQALDGNE